MVGAAERRLGSALRLLGGLGQVLDALDGRVLRPAVVQGVEQLLRELLGHVDARDDHAGDLTLLDRVVDPRERQRELVVGEADIGEVRVGARKVLGVHLEIQLALVVFHLPPTILDPWIAPTFAASRLPSGRSSSSSRAAVSGSRRSYTSRGTR